MEAAIPKNLIFLLLCASAFGQAPAQEIPPHGAAVVLFDGSNPD